MNAHTDSLCRRIVATWRLSGDDWLAYKRDMDSQDDYERWIGEMEAEASAAGKLTADLKTSNMPC